MKFLPGIQAHDLPRDTWHIDIISIGHKVKQIAHFLLCFQKQKWQTACWESFIS